MVLALSLEVGDGAVGVGGLRRGGGIFRGGGHGGRAEQRAAGRRVLAKRESNHDDGSRGARKARSRRKSRDSRSVITRRGEEGE